MGHGKSEEKVILNENPQIIFNLYFHRKAFHWIWDSKWNILGPFLVNILWETSIEFMQLSQYFNKVFPVDLF